MNKNINKITPSHYRNSGNYFHLLWRSTIFVFYLDQEIRLSLRLSLDPFVQLLSLHDARRDVAFFFKVVSIQALMGEISEFMRLSLRNPCILVARVLKLDPGFDGFESDFLEAIDLSLSLVEVIFSIILLLLNFTIFFLVVVGV